MEGLERRARARKPGARVFNTQASGEGAGSAGDGERQMSLGRIFHVEWVRFANALNEVMNEIINEQSLKWGDKRTEVSMCCRR